MISIKIFRLYLKLIFLLTLFITCNTVESNNLPSLEQYIPEPGQWKMIPNTSVSSLLTTCKDAPPGPDIKCTTPQNAFYVWVGSAYDSKKHKWYLRAKA